MIKLLWIALLLAPNGATVPAMVPDVKTFDTIELCDTYVKTHTVRMEDWFRGVLKVPLDWPIPGIQGQCEKDATPV